MSIKSILDKLLQRQMHAQHIITIIMFIYLPSNSFLVMHSSTTVSLRIARSCYLDSSIIWSSVCDI